MPNSHALTTAVPIVKRLPTRLEGEGNDRMNLRRDRAHRTLEILLQPLLLLVVNATRHITLLLDDQCTAQKHAALQRLLLVCGDIARYQAILCALLFEHAIDRASAAHALAGPGLTDLRQQHRLLDFVLHASERCHRRPPALLDLPPRIAASLRCRPASPARHVARFVLA